MKFSGLTNLFFTLLVVFGQHEIGAYADDIVVPLSDRRAEADHWRGLGIKLPKDGVIKERPYSLPLSSQSYLVPSSWHTWKLPSSVSTLALRKDLQILYRVLEDAYGGWDVAEKRGIDWNKLFYNWNLYLEASPESLPLAAAFKPWLDMSTTHLDNHSGIAGFPLGHGSQSALLQEKPSLPCSKIFLQDGRQFLLSSSDPATQPHQVKFLSNDLKIVERWIVTFPDYRSPPVRLECAGKSETLNSFGIPRDVKVKAYHADLLALANLSADEPQFVMLGPNIAYYRAPTGSAPNLAKIPNVRIPDEVRSAKILVVDLRMNDGGGSTIGPVFDWLKIKPNPSDFPFGIRTIKNSCLYPALRLGFTQAFVGGMPRLDPEAFSWIQPEFDAVTKADGLCHKAITTTTRGRNFLRRKVNFESVDSRRIIALTDNFCGSECEASLLQLAAIDNTLIFGQPTYGVVEFVQPGYFVLPHSKVRFRIALGHADVYGDGRTFDGHGIGVDLLVKPGGLSQKWLVSFLEGKLTPHNL